MKFFTAPSDDDLSIDKSWNNQAFVSFHGSWDRTRPTGYGVIRYVQVKNLPEMRVDNQYYVFFIRIPWSGNSPAASNTSGNGYSFVVQAADLSKCLEECIRPVGIAFDSKGQMFVSSDATGEVSSSPSSVNSNCQAYCECGCVLRSLSYRMSALLKTPRWDC